VSSHVTFIAGIPGAGKTALLVDLLLREVVPENRPIFIDWRLNPITHKEGPSIPGLALTHQVIPDARKWHEEGVLPDGAVLVLDEAQDIWPVAPSGAKIPPELLAMNRIRHRGISLYFTSQRPAMIHAHVRGLVGRYILLRDLGVLGRRWHEWPEFPEHPLAFKSALSTKRYKLPKRVFSMYTSASVHVKRPTFLPKSVVVLGLAVVTLGAMAWYAWGSISKKVQGNKPASAAPVVGGKPAQPLPAAAAAPRVTALRVSPPVKDREPYAGLGVHLGGTWTDGTIPRAVFTLSVDGRAIGTLSDRELGRAGYAWRWVGPCAVVLIFGDRERVATCDAPARAAPALPGPAPAASAPA
jgi:zona occludens toxin